MVKNLDSNLESMACLLRRDILRMTSAAGSGHPTSCLSSAEIVAALFFSEMCYDVSNPHNPDNDEFILSKGHAAPILYAALNHAGCINAKLLSLRKWGSPLEGHPVPSSLPWVNVATGSLGQGLSVGVGFALAAKIQKRSFRTYVLLGDSECAEGSIYEALQLASYYNLNNLCAIVDVNRLGQRGETMLGYGLEAYKTRFEAFGWNAQIINGHSIPEVLLALKNARKSLKPAVILAKTIKGKGVSFLENKDGWHGKALNNLELNKALKQLPEVEYPQVSIKSPKESKSPPIEKSPPTPNLYSKNGRVSTREAYGKSLASLAKSNSSVIALDAEVSNSTFAEYVSQSTPKQFIESYIAEQNMIGMALGLSKRGFNVFASSFAAFLTRAHDQLRMAALSSANLTICGSHCGVSIGEDGASQMGLDDIAMFRSFPHSIVFYPSDAVSTEKLAFLSSNLPGIKYIRTTRGKTPIIYNQDEVFSLGDFKTVKHSPVDEIVLIGAGITLHEALNAHLFLESHRIYSSVVDLYCVKPLHIHKLIDFVKKHGNKILVVEDHYSEGGIGEMLSHELANTGIQIRTLSVNGIPHSGKPEELLDNYDLNARAIVEEVKAMLGK